MVTIVVVHYDVLENGKGQIHKADVMASLLKQLNDLRVTLVVQTKDTKKIEQFFDAHLRNPKFVVADNILVYANSSDRLDGLKNWMLANDKKVIKPGEKTPIYHVYMIDKKIDMSAALVGRNAQFIKVTSADDHVRLLNEVVVDLKKKIEEERKLRLKNLDAEIAKLHGEANNDSMLKFNISKLNHVELEMALITEINHMLDKSRGKYSSAQPAAIPDLSLRDDEAIWQEAMQEFAESAVKNRLDKALKHNGLMGNVENLVWVKGTDQETMAKYKQWLMQVAGEVITKYRADFIKTTKEPGMTFAKLIEHYESFLDKKLLERADIQCVCFVRVEELSKPSSGLEEKRQKERAHFMFASTSGAEFIAAAKDVSETTSAEEMSNPTVFTICGGSQILRTRMSVRLGSALYEPDIQRRILADLNTTIAKTNNFDVNAGDSKSRALLHIACRKGLDQVVEYLIKEKGANIDLFIPPLGLPPIFHAIHFVAQHPNQTRVLELLLEAGATINGKVKNIDGLTALSAAATIGEGDNNAFVVELLLKFAMQKFSKNIDFFATNSNGGRTALLEAAFAKKVNVVNVFCKYGLVFTLSDIEVLTADVENHSQILLAYKKSLENCIAQFGIKPESPKCGSPTKFSAILSPKRKTTKDVSSVVPLQHPCFAQLTSLLEKYNVMADTPNGRSGSDISQYKTSRSPSFSEKLLPTFLKSPSLSSIPTPKSPADSKDPPVVENVNELDAQGYADIHKVCIIGQMGLFNELCRRSAKLNIKSKEGYTPLYYAITYGQPDLAEKLLNKQDVELEVLPDGNTLLHAAVNAHDVKTVVSLINKAKEKNKSTYIFQPNKKDNTPLMEAILSGKKEIFEAFLQNGIWLSEMDQQNLIVFIEGLPNKEDIKSALGEVLKKQLGLIDRQLEEITRKHDTRVALVPK